MPNRCGHWIAYSQLEEINTALCLKKMTSTSEIPLPDNIQPHVGSTLAWDNIDRLEETLSGEGTSHRVNGIAVHARHFGTQLNADSSDQKEECRGTGCRKSSHLQCRRWFRSSFWKICRSYPPKSSWKRTKKKPLKGLSATTCRRIRTQGVAVKKVPFESKE